jgi:hypothetical protein
MSLTAFISDKNFQELRDKFKSVFPRPSIKLMGDLIAPPLTNNYAIVGQAFDYLLRFTLEHRHKTKIQSLNHWVADSSYSMILKKMEAINSETIQIGYRRDVEKNRLGFIEMLKAEYSTAKLNYEKYLVDGILTDSLIKTVLYLARLDVTFRAAMIDPNLGNETSEDIRDIRQLIAILKDDHFKVDNHCFINPTFGDGSRLVGGADADLIIDDTLIDIKVTKNLSLERDHLNQAIGYYILSLIGGVNNNGNLKPIKNVGIYFARHGVLWKAALTDLANESQILEFKDWFHNYADVQIWGGRLDEIKKNAAELDRRDKLLEVSMKTNLKATKKKKVVLAKKKIGTKPKQKSAKKKKTR